MGSGALAPLPIVARCSPSRLRSAKNRNLGHKSPKTAITCIDTLDHYWPQRSAGSAGLVFCSCFLSGILEAFGGNHQRARN